MSLSKAAAAAVTATATATASAMVIPSSSSLPPPTPPFANYGILSGQLFLYGQGRAAFESPAAAAATSFQGSAAGVVPLPKKKCILIGGLSDGLLPVPYTQALEDKIVECNKIINDKKNDDNDENNSWSLIQPILSSSYTGFGHGSLQRDMEEIEELIDYLIKYRQAKEFALIGHSTGCQDIMYLLQHATIDKEYIEKISFVALQAPVSDRESTVAYIEKNHAAEADKEVAIRKHNEILQQAKEMITNGKGQEMMARDTFWAPITAQRFVDLNEKYGTDDYFSNDYTDIELQQRLSHVGSSSSTSTSDTTKQSSKALKVLVATSGADEYVPASVNIGQLTQRIVDAMNVHCHNDVNDDDDNDDHLVAHGLYIKTGNHNLSNDPKDAQLFVNEVGKYLVR